MENVCARGHVATKGFLLICLLLLGWPLPAVLSQSGRNKSDKGQQEKSPIKPVPPRQQLPKILNEPSNDKPANPDETIRINSDLVTVTVTTLLTTPGSLPTPLQREDFEVFEDGVPQEITNFARESEMPLRMVVLFDASMSVAQRLGFEKKAAAKFFEKMMRPQDQAAVFSISTDIDVLQEFTNRAPALINATKQLKAAGATALYDGVYLAAMW